MKISLLQRDTSFSSVVDSIRSRILSGAYPPGMQLKQSELAAALGVSQGPAREALIHLTSEGLVEQIPYRGMYVRVLAQKDIEEIYELRAALESLAVIRAMQKLQSADCFAFLQSLVEKNICAEGKGSAATAVQIDLQFHRYLVTSAENSRLTSFWDSLLSQSHALLRHLYEVQDPTERMLAANHRMILAAIKAGNQQEACEVISNHMKFAANLLIELLPGDNGRTISIGKEEYPHQREGNASKQIHTER